MRGKSVLALSVLVGMSSAASADPVASRTPQAHIQAFETDCRKNDVAAATCVCMVKTLQETPPGDAALDVMGLMAYRTGEARDAEMVPLLDRHGLRASELQAILGGDSSLVTKTAEECA